MCHPVTDTVLTLITLINYWNHSFRIECPRGQTAPARAYFSGILQNMRHSGSGQNVSSIKVNEMVWGLVRK
jgi:hypothetical protein